MTEDELFAEALAPVAALLKTKIKRLDEASPLVEFLFKDVSPNPELFTKIDPAIQKWVLTRIGMWFEEYETIVGEHVDYLQWTVDNWWIPETGYKRIHFYQSLRFALTGKESGVSITDALPLVDLYRGDGTCLKRVTEYLVALENYDRQRTLDGNVGSNAQV